MKTSLTLSTVLFALTLSPAAFANGAQEQTQASAAIPATATPSPSVTVFSVVQTPEVTSITRSVLQRLELDIRTDIRRSLRASSTLVVEALQIAAPALTEAAAKPLELGSL